MQGLCVLVTSEESVFFCTIMVRFYNDSNVNSLLRKHS